MKTAPNFKFMATAALAFFVAYGTACTKEETTTPATNTTENTSTINVEDMPYQELSEAEQNSLLFMREEEKLAHDVYVTLNALYNINAFANISESEQRHTEAILDLINKYNLTDPVGTNGMGEFTNPDLQQLYNDLVAEGSKGLEEALRVGAAIEEIDILDIEEAIEGIDNEDITLVYTNLRTGSTHHLNAFVRNLNNIGVTYEPVYLTEDQYNEIVD